MMSAEAGWRCRTIIRRERTSESSTALNSPAASSLFSRFGIDRGQQPTSLAKSSLEDQQMGLPQNRSAIALSASL
jgi:hypothetical protein